MVVGAIVVLPLLLLFFPFFFVTVHMLWALDSAIDDSSSKSSVNTFILDTIREGINRTFL